MTRARLVELKACEPGLRTFDERSDVVNGTWVLHDGWTKTVLVRLAREAPLSLRWYARKGLCPLTPAEAFSLIERVRGPQSRIERAMGLPHRMRGAGRRRQNTPQQATTAARS